eukprot:m.51216 g.51216  ORF g.51216 m.51216 type:complete len:484 (+) comp18129_c0_seq1:77-1528(+)
MGGETKNAATPVPVQEEPAVVPKPVPTPTLTVTTQPEHKQVALTNQDLYSVLSIKAPFYEPDNNERGSLDVIVVLDISGSMSGSKLDMAKKSLQFIIRNLRECDRFGLILYDTDVHPTIALTPMTTANKQKCQDECAKIRSGSMTNLSGGMLQALQDMKDRKTKGGVSSVLLLTDGLANVGITGDDGIVSAMQTARPDDVTVNTFGFGTDHKATLLKALSDNGGNGVYYFVENSESIPHAFADCLGGLLSVCAQNLSVTMTGVNGTTIGDVHTTKKVTKSANGKTVTFNLGDIQSEESRDILFQSKLAAVGEENDDDDDDENDNTNKSFFKAVEVKVTYFNVMTGKLDESTSELTLHRCSNPVQASPCEEVQQQRWRAQTTKATADALKMAENGDLDDARKAVEKTLKDLEVIDHKYSRELCDDLRECQDVLKSKSMYKSKGSHALCSKVQSHGMQRSNLASHSRGYVSYETNAKKAMKSRFR